MGEESNSADKASAPAAAGPALALAAASRERADAYLAEQTHLARLQIEREEREESLRAWSQFVVYASQVLKLAFEFVVALIVIVIAAALGAALWNARSDNGLVIEAFSVPPDLDNRGLTGEVVAGKVLDRLTDLQAQTNSNRAASSYVNNWGNDIKVQIPETGVSIGQAYRYLAGWLGHETHITGEIYRDAAGLAVTARVGGQPAVTVHGGDAALDALIQRAAEAVYRTTQPYRYAVYLDTHGRVAEARAIYTALSGGSALEDRAWAYIGLASERVAVGDFAGSNRLLHKAMAIKPDILLIYVNLASDESNLQHDEQALAYSRQAAALAAAGSRDTSMGALPFKIDDLQNRLGIAQALGDVASAAALDRAIEALPDDNGSWENARDNDVSICGALHDRACFDAALEALPPSSQLLVAVNRAANVQQADLFFGDWRDAHARGPAVTAGMRTVPAGRFLLLTTENPVLATADAELGDFGAARALLDPTPADCVVCLRARGRVAMLARAWGASEYWYRRAAALAPSTPFPFGDWGEMLLRKGDAAGASAKFAQAAARGPNYPDALELWGEALIAQSRSDLALAKFAAAARIAPHWGRLHLKWGEALWWLGRRDEARRQFALATTLYLTPAEKAQLARF